jgi:hypothetical protein
MGFLEEHRALRAKWPAGQLTAASDIIAVMITLPKKRRELANRALSLFGDPLVADWVHSALRGEQGVESRDFAVDSLTYGDQFPREHLDDYVSAACAQGMSGGNYIRRAVVCHGKVATLNAMTRAAEAGVLGYHARRFLQYYVGAKSDDAEVDAAFRRLQDVTFEAADAPLGARRAGEPREPE